MSIQLVRPIRRGAAVPTAAFGNLSPGSGADASTSDHRGASFRIPWRSVLIFLECDRLACALRHNAFWPSEL